MRHPIVLDLPFNLPLALWPHEAVTQLLLAVVEGRLHGRRGLPAARYARANMAPTLPTARVGTNLAQMARHGP